MTTKYRFNWGTIELVLLAGILLFIVLIFARCDKEGTFNAPAIAECQGGVEWRAVAKGEIQASGYTSLPLLQVGDCTRILFSGHNGPTTVTIAVEDSDDDGNTWIKLCEITNPKEAEGWGGTANNSQYRISATNYTAGTVSWAVYPGQAEVQMKKFPTTLYVKFEQATGRDDDFHVVVDGLGDDDLSDGDEIATYRRISISRMIQRRELVEVKQAKKKAK